MTTRQAACDPCRRQKLACDHKRPVCTRCERSQKRASCVYRATPFKRKRRLDVQTHYVSESPVIGDSDHVDSVPAADSAETSPLQQRPNPEYYGLPSHVAIFDQLGPLSEQGSSQASIVNGHSVTNLAVVNAVEQSTESFNKLFSSFDLVTTKQLVDFWLEKGVSLALAEPIVPQCAESVLLLHSTLQAYGKEFKTSDAVRLLQNSKQALESSANSALSDFTAQFCNSSIRWETLAIFLSAAIRATFDVPYFPKLYTTDAQKHAFRVLAIRLNNHALTLCLSLDCPNDLQLIAQYENFIVHSYVDGDHSLSLWRSLGDVIASLFALGYHENIMDKTNVPSFLVRIRQVAFARVYSADKNLALFLGRPPRMSKRFCCFQLPSNHPQAQAEPDFLNLWQADTRMDYVSETCWSAVCANIKEEILELLLGNKKQARTELISKLSERAENQWQLLPGNFRLEASLKNLPALTPFERDFVASLRLNYLHVKFLLRLVLLPRLAEPDSEIVDIALQILSLTVELILFRDRLANSGTGLTWKITHYGLPAAGILLLGLLRGDELLRLSASLQSKIQRDLYILVAEVQTGCVVGPEEPNYAMLSKAISTISSFLGSLDVEKGSAQPPNDFEPQVDPLDDIWLGQWTADPWNLEIGFWQSLDEHPLVFDTELRSE